MQPTVTATGPSTGPGEWDVLVVGAGPVGMGLAIELGLRGMNVLLVEQRERAGAAPRAKTTNVRTRTILRRWELADRLAQEAPLGLDYPSDMRFVTSLAGYPLATFENAFSTAPVRADTHPEHGQWVPQYTLERILREKVQSLPTVSLHMGVRFLSFHQDEHGIHATLADGKGEMQVEARYLVGADGARSAVREAIGARMEGRHGFSRHFNIIFRGTGLAQAHKHGKAVAYWQVGPSGFSAVGPMDKDDLWFFGCAAEGEATTLTDEDAAARIRTATGIDLPFEIVAKDFWVSSELLADRYSKGRAFLAGDACHQHPPFGGYGMNMGIGDALDLGWKLAATLQGWAGDGLLGSYEAERRPVHRTVIDEAVANHPASLPLDMLSVIEEASPRGEAVRTGVGARIAATKGREFHTLGTVLGLSYAGSPIVAVDPESPPAHDAQNYRPSAVPGCLAPHAWLPDGRSLYDLFGPGFTLLAAPEAAGLAAAQADAARLGVPLRIVQPDGIDLRALYGARLALIRPDQFVAWRGDAWQDVFPLVTGQ
ncbi:FAD-dependent oxidoreductase [Niveispirillum sp.]|uniref:FAD-dependent oxidoreductase n=1 Tax=Niveispirillum sp. TaxID=1917217 RepID=UPI001B740B42|nr:FAD-dependent oxidoreductase [Niveispirillum sp.]MBP7338616.1 FAD-dependent monooxygenase [Niveispirillum sp.]